MQIDRLLDIDKIWEIQNNYEKNNGIRIINVSDWNCNQNFKCQMQRIFKFQPHNDYIDYFYSYSISDKKIAELKSKFHFIDNKNEDIFITPNNTVSIIYIANLIKKCSLKKTCIIAPAYFSVYNIFETLGIDYDRISLCKDDQFKLDRSIDYEKYDAIWITSPIFCSGVYFDKNELDFLRKIAQDKMLITDESFCNFGKEVANLIDIENHIGIYCPHKAIGFNSFKFSLITFNEKYSSLIEQWSDVLCGSLNVTNHDAINHFLSDNFKLCELTHKNFIANARKEIINILKNYKSLSFINQYDSNMIMIFSSKNIDPNETFIKETIKNTMASFFPGYLHDYDNSFGFCFRINLYLYDERFKIVFNNLCNYLDNL